MLAYGPQCRRNGELSAGRKEITAVRASHPAAAYRKRQAEPARPPLCGVTAAEGGFFMDSHPFSAAYWHMAAGELKNVRKLTFAALCMALCMALSAIPSVHPVKSASSKLPLIR